MVFNNRLLALTFLSRMVVSKENIGIFLILLELVCFKGVFWLIFWGESIMTAAHIINRTPSSLLKGKTPYELLHGKPPAYDLLRVFGCLCYAHCRAHDKDKFGERSCKCIFVGYPFGTKGWRLYDIERNNKYFISRDVTFFENMFPGIEDASYVPPPVLQINTPSDDWLVLMSPSRGSTHSSPPPETPAASPTTPTPPVTTTPDNETSPADPTAQSTATSSSESTLPSFPPANASSTPTIEPKETQHMSSSPGLPKVLRRGHRTKKSSILLKNFVTHAAIKNPSHAHSLSDRPPLTTVSGKTLYPIANYLSTSVFNEKHQAILVTITTEVVPKTYNQAVRDPRFNNPMKTEIVALEDSVRGMSRPYHPERR